MIEQVAGALAGEGEKMVVFCTIKKNIVNGVGWNSRRYDGYAGDYHVCLVWI